mgnify:CR=1 FL=1
MTTTPSTSYAPRLVMPHTLVVVMLLVILQAVSKVLLILLDIEDNTRRSAR